MEVKLQPQDANVQLGPPITVAGSAFRAPLNKLLVGRHTPTIRSRMSPDLPRIRERLIDLVAELAVKNLEQAA
jgi:hypothetical protein